MVAAERLRRSKYCEEHSIDHYANSTERFPLSSRITCSICDSTYQLLTSKRLGEEGKAFNELLPMYSIERSMSRAGTPTDNGAMEAINGWVKTELMTDFHVTGEKPIADEIDGYIHFFNYERPAYSLNYLTPVQYREKYSAVRF